MQIKYEFVTGDTTEVEVPEELGTMVIDSRREEENGDRREHRHCWSLDALLYEGSEFGTTGDLNDVLEKENLKKRINAVFSDLSEIQKRKILMLAGGLSIQEIARREGRDFRTVYDSIEAARKKFKKFF